MRSTPARPDPTNQMRSEDGMSTARWQVRPSGSTWGDWGPDDQLGRLNLLTPEIVRRAADEVQEGRAFSLSLPLDLPGGTVLNPNRRPPVIRPTYDADGPRYNLPWSRTDPRFVDVSSDDVVELTLQYSTQWDSFAHVGAYFDVDASGTEVPVYYNGFRAGVDVLGPEDLPAEGGPRSFARRLSVDTFAAAPVQGRGVLIDLYHHLGDEFQKVDHATLESVMRADGVEVEPGDIVLLRTGFADRILEAAAGGRSIDLHRTCSVLDGSDQRLLDWIADSGIVAIAADNYAVETFDIPRDSQRQPSMPIHHLCLFKLGVLLGEMWSYGELAAALRSAGRTRCFVTAPPLRLPGAVGSPANGVATI